MTSNNPIKFARTKHGLEKDQWGQSKLIIVNDRSWPMAEVDPKQTFIAIFKFIKIQIIHHKE